MKNVKTSKPKIKEKKLGREMAMGQCYDGIIEIDPRQTSEEYLDTMIHEMLHHHFPELTEEQVIKISNLMSKSLWNKGYRRIMD